MSSPSERDRRFEVLVVDDESTQRVMLQNILERAGYRVRTAGAGPEAMERIEQRGPDVVLCDQRMPGFDGIEVLRRVRALDASIPVVLMTAYGSVETAVCAMKLGAADYLSKPFEKDELLLVLERVLQQQRMRRELLELRHALQDRVGLSGIVGASAPMQEVFSLIERVADADVPVLITGESGTGKELVARAIHQRSRRAGAPFVAVNCAAVPEALLESEFFGHEPGAFTGAGHRRIGAFEQADGGTLLLDEIGAMRIDLQAKLLRAIQEREIQRLGAARPTRVDVRILAATSEDLGEAILRRTFREDLFYRLNVVPIELPPLRDRPEDVPLLLRHLVQLAAARLHREPPSIAPEVVDRCQTWTWPGNVRELQNCVERMVVLARGDRLTLHDLPDAVRDGEVHPSPLGDRFDLPRDGVRLEDVERHLIVQALHRARGGLGPASRLLGITYKTLQYRIRKHRIEREEFAAGESDGDDRRPLTRSRAERDPTPAARSLP